MMTSEAPRPSDFTIGYVWQEGSVPPPYHYEYVIRIDPEGRGEIVFYPDYPSHDAPCWVEAFSVAEASLNELHALIVEHDLLHRDWPEARERTIGGSQEWLEIVSDGESVRLPSRASGDEGTFAIYALIRGLVPKAMWKVLMSRREQFERDYKQGER